MPSSLLRWIVRDNSGAVVSVAFMEFVMAVVQNYLKFQHRCQFLMLHASDVESCSTSVRMAPINFAFTAMTA